MHSLYKKCVQLAEKPVHKTVRDFPLFQYAVDNNRDYSNTNLVFPHLYAARPRRWTQVLPRLLDYFYSVTWRLSAVSTPPIMITITLYKEETIK